MDAYRIAAARYDSMEQPFVADTSTDIREALRLARFWKRHLRAAKAVQS